MRTEVTGLGGLIVLALDIWAIISVIGSNASMPKKIAWLLAIILLPIVGFIIWFFVGPRAADQKGV